MILIPLWWLSVIGVFLRLAGQKAEAEIRKNKEREKKRLKAIEREKRKLALLRVERGLEIEAEKKRVLANKAKRKAIREKIESLRVPVGKNPYATAEPPGPSTEGKSEENNGQN